MKHPKYKAFIEKFGDDIDFDYKALRRFFDEMPENVKYVNEIKPYKPFNAGGDQQRKYYFGIIVAFWMQETGYEKTEMHEVLKENFGITEIDEHGLNNTLGYRHMSVEQREQYHEKCRRAFFSTFGGHIPLPNEVPESLYEEMSKLI